MADVPEDYKTDSKKLVGLRTFADDVKRARKAQNIPTPEIENAPEVKAPEPKPDKGLANAVQDEVDNIKESKPPLVPKIDDVPSEEIAAEEAVPSEPMEIPPFHFIRASSPDDSNYDKEHTIPDKAETVQKSAPAKPLPTHTIEVDTNIVPDQIASALSNRDGVFDTEEAIMDVGEGSIVTDKKRRKFRLLPAIGAALSRWFGKKTDAIREQRKPKHTIKKSSRRKEVIEAAAKQAKQAPSDDYVAVSERLKSVERITDTKELQIKDEAEVPKPTWGSTEDEVHEQAIDSLEEAIDGESAAVVPKEDSVSQTPISEAAVQPEAKPEPVIKSTAPSEPAEPKPKPVTLTPSPEETKKTVEVSSPTLPLAPKIPTPAPSPVRASGYNEYREKFGEDFSPKEETFAESLPPAPETVDQNEILRPKLQRTPVPDYRLDRTGRAIPRTSGTPYLTFAAVIMVAVILGIGLSVWWFTRDTVETEIIATPVQQTNLPAATLSSIELTPNSTEFFRSLLEQAAQAGGTTVEYYPTEAGVLVDPEIVFQTLGLRAPSSFARSISNLTLGVSQDEPFILLKINSFDNAFGGILAWESSMAADLSPLFGPPEPTKSVDVRVNNRDLRVLSRPDTTDKIVYGFIDKNTILITSSRSAYVRLAEQI